MKAIHLFYFLPFTFFINCKQEKKEQETENKHQDITQVEKQDSLVTTRIDSSQIPKSLKYTGYFRDGFRWKDKTGEYIVITSETGIERNMEGQNEFDDGGGAKLFAHCYSLDNNQQVWKVYDYIKDCPVDIVTEFVKNSLAVTDLDKNGIAEVWATYKMGCQGGVDPLNMKIIMYEGQKKFAIRGESRVQYGTNDNNKPMYAGGIYTFDKVFKEGPEVFREYADKLWKKNVQD